MVAKSFRLLPEKHQAKTEWNARTWAKERRGWIFITSRPPERETLRPLHSLWIDLLVMRLLSAPQPGQRHVWFVIDELASLQKLPQLHTAITENRKSKNPLVLGFQGKAQLEVIYGHLAEVMLSQPATKIYMKTAEPKAAEWISEAIGKVEIERVKETKFDGSRSGKNFTIDRQIEPLVMGSEITGLDDRHAYLKLGKQRRPLRLRLHRPSHGHGWFPAAQVRGRRHELQSRHPGATRPATSLRKERGLGRKAGGAASSGSNDKRTGPNRQRESIRTFARKETGAYPLADERRGTGTGSGRRKEPARA